MKRFYRVGALALAVVMLSCSTIFAAVNFYDVAASYGLYNEIQAAAEAKIIEGYPADANGRIYFKPKNNVSLQQGRVMINRTMISKGLLEDTPEARTIAEGKTPGTRETIAVWVAADMGYTLSPLAALSYHDVYDIKAEDMQAIDALYRYGIMQGTQAGNFDVASVTRAHFAAICVRALNCDTELHSIARDFTNLTGKVSAVSASAGEFKLTTADGAVYRCRIDEEAGLLIGGKVSVINAIEALEGKTICVGACAYGNCVLISTQMQVESGYVDGVAEYGDHIAVEIDGIYYYADKALAGSVRGGSCSFIAEGAHILEIEQR